MAQPPHELEDAGDAGGVVVGAWHRGRPNRLERERRRERERGAAGHPHGAPPRERRRDHGELRDERQGGATLGPCGPGVARPDEPGCQISPVWAAS